VDNWLEKIHFADLVKDVNSVAGFLLSTDFEWDGMMSHKHGLATIYSFKMAAFKVKFWASFEMNFFRLLQLRG